MKYKEHFELIRKPMTECSSSLSLELELKQVKPFDFSKLNLVDTNIVESINKKVYENLGIAEDTLILREALYKASMYDKLCKDLGCPLDFATTPYRLSGLKKIWYHKQWCDVVRIVCYEEATKPYMEVRCKDYKYLKMIFLDDYKNTWWLKEDKSE